MMVVFIIKLPLIVILSHDFRKAECRGEGSRSLGMAIHGATLVYPICEILRLSLRLPSLKLRQAGSGSG